MLLKSTFKTMLIFSHKFTFFIICVFISLGALSQEPKEIKKANKEYNNESYYTAAKLTIEAFEKVNPKSKKANDRKGDMAFKTAECFRHVEDFKQAIEWYQKALSFNYQKNKPEVLFYYAEMSRYLGDCKVATENYKAYKAMVPSDKRLEAGLNACKLISEFELNKTRHIITNVNVLNKEGFDMSPVWADKKRSSIVFSSDRPSSLNGDVDPRSGGTLMDLWVAQKDKNDNWQEPALINGEKINTEFNEGTVCFDSKYKKMFFTRCPKESNKNLGCEIWLSDIRGKEWGEPTKLPIKSDDTISVGHPCVSGDGNYLIFASNMSGGFGGLDLWYTTYSKKTNLWSVPVNLGPEINTAGDEMFPSFNSYEDLYFSSNGHPGLGALDIFKAQRVVDSDKYLWENPVNIGLPRNSEANDYSLIEINENAGFFTSERKNGVGNNSKPDLYNYKLPPNNYDLKIMVSKLGQSERKISSVKVLIQGADGSVVEGKTDRLGQVFFDVKENGERIIKENMDYTIITYKAGSEKNKSETKFTTRGVTFDQNFIIDVPLLIPEEKIRIPEVRYAFGKWELLQDSTISSKDSLNFVYDVLMKYPKMILELSSHTDSRSTDEYNQKLSENRARECVKYLVEEKGIDIRRLIPVGKGEKEPVKWIDAAGKTNLLSESYINQYKSSDAILFEKLHALNRRTEGMVRSMDFDPSLAEQKLLDPLVDLSKIKKGNKKKKKKKN